MTKPAPQIIKEAKDICEHCGYDRKTIEDRQFECQYQPDRKHSFLSV